jgi:hypothetical protein
MLINTDSIEQLQNNESHIDFMPSLRIKIKPATASKQTHPTLEAAVG